jgi:putative transposase
MLKQHGGNSRYVWNKLLEYSNNIKKSSDKYPNQSSLQKHIIKLKSENDFIKISHSQPIQINALRLANTYTRAFDPLVVSERNKKIAIAKNIQDEDKKNKALSIALNFGFPKFKSKNRHPDSIFYPQNFIIKRSRIFFPKIGWIGYIKHRDIEGLSKFVTITQDGNQYYVSITSEIEVKESVKVDLDKANIIGIDVGLKNFATLSDGTIIKNPRTLNKNLKKLRKESKSLDRKENKETGEKTIYGKIIKKSSNNRNKQIIKLQKVYRKVRNVRSDFLHKTTYHIINKYDGIILENLDIKEMQKNNNKNINRSISDVSWYEFGRILNYKSAWNSKHFAQVNQYFPSTQICNSCGNRMNLSIKDRVYSCPNCKAVSDRDLNASRNIKDEGIKILKQIKENTVAATEIKARGSTAIAVGMKREKRRFRQSSMIAA